MQTNFICFRSRACERHRFHFHPFQRGIQPPSEDSLNGSRQPRTTLRSYPAPLAFCARAVLRVRAGFTHGGFCRHFESKEALIAEASMAAFDEFQTRLERTKADKAALIVRDTHIFSPPFASSSFNSFRFLVTS